MAVDPLRIFGLLESQDLEPSGETPELGRAKPESEPEPEPVSSGVLIGGRFRVKSGLGRGAFGDVVRATDETLSRDVAIKVLRRGDAHMRARFLREAQATASLQHPNVLTVYQVGEHAERPYIVYELVEDARDLEEAFADHDLEGRLDLFEQVLAGVAAAHGRGIVHRDLKPENVLVTGPGRVYVADFGIAHVAESSLTATGQFLGTPAYMAPEQVLGQETSAATDVWALGQILYQALYGTSWLTDSLTIQELIGRICAAKFTPPSKPDVPSPVAQLLFASVLRRQPSERLPDAQVFLSKLQLARRRRAAVVGASRRWVASALWVIVGTLGGAILTGSLLGNRGAGPALAQASPPPASPAPASPPSGPVRSPLAGPAPSPSASAASPELSPLATTLPQPSPAATPPELSASPAPSASPASSASPEPSASPERSAPLELWGTSNYFALRRRLKLAPTEEVRSAAVQEQVAAMRVLGRRLFLGWRVARDVGAGREWLERAALGGCADSMEDLSRAYRSPERTPEENRARLRWHAAAVKAEALSALARSHLHEKGVLPLASARLALARGDEEAGLVMGQLFFETGKRERALDWLTAGIALGSLESRGARARIELLQAKADLPRAIADLRAGVSVGDSTSGMEYARCLMRGRGVPVDLAAARRLLAGPCVAGATPGDLAYFRLLLDFRETAAEAEKGGGRKHFEFDERVKVCQSTGSAYARGELALLMLQVGGKDLAPRIREAITSLFRSAPLSFNPAVHVQFGLALFDKRLPVAEPLVEAARSFRRAALLGDPLGYLNWGTSLVRGFGVERDVDQGILWLSRASAVGLLRAQTHLGHIYTNSVVYPKHYDLERAIGYLEIARKGGEPDPFKALALELEREERLAAPTRRLFEIAASQGDAEAACHYARFLLSGRGGAKDEAGAVAALERVPEGARTAELCELLGDCYAAGRGVVADPKAAALWRARAKALPAPAPTKAGD